jgi:hypothetical protein
MHQSSRDHLKCPHIERCAGIFLHILLPIKAKNVVTVAEQVLHQGRADRHWRHIRFACFTD